MERNVEEKKKMFVYMNLLALPNPPPFMRMSLCRINIVQRKKKASVLSFFYIPMVFRIP